MPGASELNWQVHVTCLIPPGKSTGTWNPKPVTNALPASPDEGITVSHSCEAESNSVVASVDAGENVTDARGTSSTYGSPPATKSMVESSHRTVKAAGFGPGTLSTLLNQMNASFGIAVPLKFDVIDTGAGEHAGNVVDDVLEGVVAVVVVGAARVLVVVVVVGWAVVVVGTCVVVVVWVVVVVGGCVVVVVVGGWAVGVVGAGVVVVVVVVGWVVVVVGACVVVVVVVGWTVVVVVGACVVVVVLVMVVVVVGTEPVTDTLHPFAVIGRIFTSFVSNRLSTLSPMEVVVLAIAATLKVIFATLTTPFGDVTFMTWKAALFVAPGVGVLD